MTDYFAEKAGQIEPGTLVAFGITISSRYRKANELIEMLAFCRLMAMEKLSHNVKELFYDSKANMCSFTFVDSVAKGDSVAHKAYDAAKQTISQFELFGYVDHGADLAEED